MEQEKVQELLKVKLREKGLKVTQQRLLVLQTLAKMCIRDSRKSIWMQR